MRQGLHSIPWNSPMASIRTPSSSTKDASGNARQGDECGCREARGASPSPPFRVSVIPLSGIAGNRAFRARRSPRQWNGWESKTMTDEILRELWQIKDRIAEENDYSLDTLVSTLRSKSENAPNPAWRNGDARRDSLRRERRVR